MLKVLRHVFSGVTARDKISESFSVFCVSVTGVWSPALEHIMF